MALSKNVGNLLGRVASNHKTSIIQAINLGRVAVASNRVPKKKSPPFVERVTVEASGSGYWGEGYGGRGRDGANNSGEKLTDADGHGRDSGDGGGIGFWEWLTGGGDGSCDGGGGGDGGDGGGDC